MKIKELRYTFNDKIIYKTVKSSDGSVLIIAHNPDTGDMYEFNSVGSDLFEMLRSSLSIKSIVQKLADEYDAEIENICEDIAPFIERFIELGLIEINSKGASGQDSLTGNS